ncbi:MAG: hypothetical protein JSW52_09995 [Candidatus Coatesbacteria bacterium]|nr:MAG: hypothetical protein JSW52_09995 [Candidatus Coatesbacteria bacterium]
MRLLTLIAISFLLPGFAFASVPVLYLHDSPAPPTGDQIWNDQWSGGVANPTGEYMDQNPPFHSTPPPPWAVVNIPVDPEFVVCHDVADVHYVDGDYDAYLWLKKTTAAAPYETIGVSVWDETLSGPLEDLIAGPTQIQITDYTNWQEYHFHLPFVESQDDPRIALVVSMLEWENAQLSWDHVDHPSRLVTPGATGINPTSLGNVKAVFR